MRTVAVLGCTGTIGRNALDVISRYPDRFQVGTLALRENIAEARGVIDRFRPRLVAVENERACASLQAEFPGIEFVSGPGAAEAAAAFPDVDTVVVGIVGFWALRPTFAAVRAGKRVALANKEVLVAAGHLLKAEMRRSGAEVIPVDSEHNALYQLLEGRRSEEVASLLITASGGPIWRRPELALEDVTPEIAVKHPNWRMGPKISVDSATLMNKGLELIEAAVFFDTPADRIEICIHPQSILHGAVWLTDNTCIAQLSAPDMRASIGHAMGWPERLPGVIPKLPFEQMSRLEFHPVDDSRFPAPMLARAAARGGGALPVALNAANEVAVQAFLDGRISFPRITRLVGEVVEHFPSVGVDGIEAVCAADEEARRMAGERLGSPSG